MVGASAAAWPVDGGQGSRTGSVRLSRLPALQIGRVRQTVGRVRQTLRALQSPANESSQGLGCRA